MNSVATFEEIYPSLELNALLNGSAPVHLQRELDRAKVDTWH
jgi:hypothetical protein